MRGEVAASFDGMVLLEPPHLPPDDRDKRVVHIEEYVRPFRISRVCLKAQSVLELPPHTAFRTGTRVGDQVEIGRVGERTAVSRQSEVPLP